MRTHASRECSALRNTSVLFFAFEFQLHLDFRWKFYPSLEVMHSRPSSAPFNCYLIIKDSRNVWTWNYLISTIPIEPSKLSIAFHFTLKNVLMWSIYKLYCVSACYLFSKNGGRVVIECSCFFLLCSEVSRNNSFFRSLMLEFYFLLTSFQWNNFCNRHK